MRLLDQLKAAHAAATPGEWGCEAALSSDFSNIRYITADLGKLISSIASVRMRDEIGQDQSIANAEFIALTKNAMPHLLTAADKLAALLEWAEHTGGWEAPCWAEAKAAMDKLREPTP